MSIVIVAVINRYRIADFPLVAFTSFTITIFPIVAIFRVLIGRFYETATGFFHIFGSHVDNTIGTTLESIPI